MWGKVLITLSTRHRQRTIVYWVTFGFIGCHRVLIRETYMKQLETYYNAAIPGSLSLLMMAFVCGSTYWIKNLKALKMP